MKKSILFLLVLLFVSITGPPSSAYVRVDKNSIGDGPRLSTLDLESHDINAVFLMVSNQGPIGLDLRTGGGRGFFPSNTSNNYVYGTGLWFGANYDADGDTDLDKVFTQGYNPLAGDSEFREGRNDQNEDDPLTRIFDSRVPEDLQEWPPQFSDPGTGDPIVYSDQDLVTTYTTQDRLPNFGMFQLPLDVNQRSMAFISPDSMAQVIFFVFDVENTGNDVLTDAWIGYDSDMDIGQAFDDDLSSFILDWIKPGGDTVTLDVGFAWDSDFTESNFTGDPGFIGVSLLVSPGDPNDGIDNDGDGLVDESPFNGLDDDGDSYVDEWDEVDEIGLTNYSKHCNPAVPCEVLDPRSDESGYDILHCDDPGDTLVCLESTTPADVRFMLSSGPFDWQPGQTQMIAIAMIFAYSTGDHVLPFVGEPPRPDPNDDDLVEFVRIAEQARELFPSLFPTVGIGDDLGDPGIGLPAAYALYQNYPNPFNPMTTISFEIPDFARTSIPGAEGERQRVTLVIYDVRGRRVSTLIDSNLEPGSHRVVWNGRNDGGSAVSSGIYLYSLRCGEQSYTRKMVVRK